MAANQTLAHLADSGNFDSSQISLSPRHGVITLSGYGINVRVDRGHLLLEDGIGANRYKTRLPRVGHGLKRLVVVGSDGMVSLAAIRWLADQGAAFVMLERNGKVLATTGPVQPSDVKLRRAQALAHQSGLDIQIARKLIAHKLNSQEHVARAMLGNPDAANMIAQYRDALQSANTQDQIRGLEARAAAAYWQAWRSVTVIFPNKDLPRVPEHWCIFGNRISPLSGSPRLAANPANAILNYLYALLEAEARLAATALGLDPGIGVLHLDSSRRDSLAFDLMEPIRPQVDALVFDLITRQTLKREWFFEQRDGNCRLMAACTAMLAETSSKWARAVAPIAEWVAHTLWAGSGDKAWKAPATRLTQSRKRDARKRLYIPDKRMATGFCSSCGSWTERGGGLCGECRAREVKSRMRNSAR